MSPAGRRLTLSPIGFDIILALSQAPGGLRLAEVSHVIGSPVSSAQTSLRVLVANGLVRREGEDPPRYLLSEHPARAGIVHAATVIADAARSIGIVLRANPAVAWAAVDPVGFLAGLVPDPPAGSVEALDLRLRMIDESRPGSPAVARMPIGDLERLVRVELELRARVRRAHTIKGRPPVAVRPTGALEGRRAG